MDGDGGRLSAAEKGKEKAADDADLPAALALGSEGEPRPAADAVANCYGDGGGAGIPLPRRLLIPPSGTSELEEAPPSPPPAAPSRLPALNAADAAAAVVGLKSSVKELQAALEGQLWELQQLGGRARDLRLKPVSADEPGPEVAGGAEVQALQPQLGTVHERAEEMQALEEFWKPVPVPRRNNSKRKTHLGQRDDEIATLKAQMGDVQTNYANFIAYLQQLTAGMPNAPPMNFPIPPAPGAAPSPHMSHGFIQGPYHESPGAGRSGTGYPTQFPTQKPPFQGWDGPGTS